jgi:hypothetical protein
MLDEQEQADDESLDLENLTEAAAPVGDGLAEVIIATDSHSHAGSNLSKGDKIRVTPDDWAWLAEHHLIEV